MQFTLLTAVALFVTSVLAQENTLYMNEPKITQCGKVKSTWSSGKGTYNLIAVPASNICGDPLQVIGDTDKTFLDWTARIPAGSVIQLTVADSEDGEGWTEDITVGPSDDASCLPGATSSSTPTSSVTGSGSGSGSTGSGSTGGSDDTDADSEIVPIGAANAGSNAIFNSAPSARQASSSIMALSAIAAIAVLAL